MRKVGDTRSVLHTLLAVSVATLTAGVFGCARTLHSVEPYRSDPQAARHLEERATESCSDQPSPLPSRQFVTDGCSVFPDSDWVECCVSHDIDYWCGGSAEQRRRADRELGECVGRTGRPTLGWWMGKGVRLGGVPIAPTPWRWGYGWEWPKGYASETNAGEARDPDPEDLAEIEIPPK